MAEISDASNAATLSDHYEGSHGSSGGSNINDDELNLPNYMTHSPPIN